MTGDGTRHQPITNTIMPREWSLDTHTQAQRARVAASASPQQRQAFQWPQYLDDALLCVAGSPRPFM